MRRCWENVRAAGRVSKLGKGRHYAEHMNGLVEMVLAAGKRPILWADCLQHHLDGLRWIDPRVVLCDWFYENFALHQNWAYVRAADFYSEEIKRSNNPWARRGAWSVIVTKHTVDRLKPALRRTLGPYLSRGVKDYPNRFHAFPYLRYFRDRGFDVMYACSVRAAGGDNRYCVDYDLHLKNCAAAAQAAAEVNGLGLITTSWAASGFCPLETQFLAMAFAAQGTRGADRLASAYERKAFGKPIGLLEAYCRLHRCSFSPPLRFGANGFQPAPLAEQMARIGDGPGLFHRLDEAERLAQWAREAGPHHREIELVRYAAEELRYKYRLALAYHERRAGNRIGGAALREDLASAKKRFDETFRNHFTAWYLKQERTLRFGADEHWIGALTRNGPRVRRAQCAQPGKHT